LTYFSDKKFCDQFTDDNNNININNICICNNKYNNSSDMIEKLF